MKILRMFIILLCILMLNYFGQSFAMSYINFLTSKYEKTISCDKIHEMYNLNDLEHMAADEFEYFYNKQGDEKTRKIQPTL